MDTKFYVPNMREMLYMLYKHTNVLMLEKAFFQLTVNVKPKIA